MITPTFLWNPRAPPDSIASAQPQPPAFFSCFGARESDQINILGKRFPRLDKVPSSRAGRVPRRPFFTEFNRIRLLSLPVKPIDSCAYDALPSRFVNENPTNENGLNDWFKLAWYLLSNSHQRTVEAGCRVADGAPLGWPAVLSQRTLRLIFPIFFFGSFLLRFLAWRCRFFFSPSLRFDGLDD